MRRFGWMALLGGAVILIAAFAPVTARAQQQPAGIRVTGQGVVTARPDVADLTVGATVRRESAGAAFSRSEDLVAALKERLKANGVAERDIQTRQFSLSPEYGRSTGDTPPAVIGWRAVHTLSVTLRDFGRIGATIDEAVRTLGDEALVQGISFSIEDTNALAARARAEAIADARRRAEQMASLAGVRLGQLTFLSEQFAPAPAPVRELAAGGAVARAQAQQTADISPGELTLTVSVEAIFAIE